MLVVGELSQLGAVPSHQLRIDSAEHAHSQGNRHGMNHHWSPEAPRIMIRARRAAMDPQ
jgi:hypothetical protein